MASPRTVIADAFEGFNRSISVEDARTFMNTGLEDVWSAAKDIDKEQRRRQLAQNLRRVEPLLQRIESYAKVSEVLCNGTPYLTCVWVRPYF